MDEWATGGRRLVGRRQVITWGVGTATGLFLTGKLGIVQILATSAGTLGAGSAVPTLDPSSIPKYVTAVLIPPAMPRARKLRTTAGKNVDYYEIAVRQFDQQILPPGLPSTTVWGYGPRVAQGGPLIFNAPSLTIEAKWNAPVRVTWVNELVDGAGNFLPHLLPVDQTLHWANPPGPTDHTGEPTLEPYVGPVPIVTHVHGSATTDDSDGYAEAWYLPDAGDIPAGYALAGTFHAPFAAQAQAKGQLAPGTTEWAPGTSVFEYPNAQPATTCWYHDHTLGMTRLNVYAGPAGFFIIRGGPGDAVRDDRGRPAVLPGPAPAIGDTPGMAYHEIPLAIQDRSFNDDGSLFFPDSRAFFDEFTGPYIGSNESSDIAPIWNPEFFGNTIMVNGNTWPMLAVEARRYRFRFLNGCNSRFLILRTTTEDPEAAGYEPLAATAGPAFWQIGAEGGFLPAPVELSELLMGPAERADVIVDFAGLTGQTVTLVNVAPDEPFGGGVPGADFEPADAASTGQIMRFVVGAAPRGGDRTTPPSRLLLPSVPAVPPATVTRRLLLAEEDSEVLDEVGPKAALLGVVTADDSGTITGACAKSWMDPITENPERGVPEVWEIYNATADAHPIHLHEVQFQVVGRQSLVIDEEGMPLQPFALAGRPRAPEAWERGLKDTVIAYPGEVTRLRVVFDVAGLFVWHCHIVDHEDNEMMRPLYVGTPDPSTPVGRLIVERGMLADSATCERDDDMAPTSTHHRPT
jgi:spore coat protein A